MKKIFLIIILFFSTASITYAGYFDFIKQLFNKVDSITLGAGVYQPVQGGTGIGSVTSGDIDSCLKVQDDSPFTFYLDTCGSGGGGGGGGGGISTTTSQVAGQLIFYPYETDGIFVVGGNSTSSAEVYIDPNLDSGNGISFFKGRILSGSNASLTDFPNTNAIFSQGNTGQTSTSNAGLFAEGVASGSSGRGVYGIGQSSGSLHGFGVYGLATTTNSSDTAIGWGVYGSATAVRSGNNVGVRGDGQRGDSAIGLQGVSFLGSSENRGVDGVAYTNGSAPAYAILGSGLAGSSGDSGIAYGGYFQSVSTHSGGLNIGVLGSATNGSSNFSFYGLNGVLYNSGNVGFGTTSPYAKLSVVGETAASHFTATTTNVNTFPNASTTQLSISDKAYIPLPVSIILSGTSTMGQGTTTRVFSWSQDSTITEMGCSSTGSGTFQAIIGDSTASSTLITSGTGNTTSYTTLSSNNTFTRGEKIYISFGGVSGTVSNPECSLTRLLR